MDVLDLAWSNNDEYLASCSIDNNVLVWKTTSLTIIMTPIRVLSGHSNWVKVCLVTSLNIKIDNNQGVAWDPIGRFLASASADKSADTGALGLRKHVEYSCVGYSLACP